MREHMEDLIFDWVALAPIEDVAARAEQVSGARGLAGTWYSSAPGGIPVKGCRLIDSHGATVAVLTLQGFQPDQTHLRLQPAARASEPSLVAGLADDLYAALRDAGWIPSSSPLLDHTPRFVRPAGFTPRPGEQPPANTEDQS
jgi:hypothetical protein